MSTLYNSVTLLYSRDWHNIVNQLYFNKKIKLKKTNSVNTFTPSPPGIITKAKREENAAQTPF